MAKFGEGDARWIVEERTDGTNVNGWHWTEKDVKKPAEQMIRDIVTNMEPIDGCIFSVNQFTGFINLCNRKGKLKVTYSLEVTLKWKREVRDNPDEEASSSAGGTIVMDEIIDEEPEAEFVLDRKKTKGSAAVPDRGLQTKLCSEATKCVARLLADLKAGKLTDVSSPVSNQIATTTCDNNNNAVEHDDSKLNLNCNTRTKA